MSIIRVSASPFSLRASNAALMMAIRRSRFRSRPGATLSTTRDSGRRPGGRSALGRSRHPVLDIPAKIFLTRYAGVARHSGLGGYLPERGRGRVAAGGREGEPGQEMGPAHRVRGGLAGRQAAVLDGDAGAVWRWGQGD